MSTFVWIDHSEKQRRQILDAMDLFRDKDTRDELGLAGIRDAFADILFPGTGTLQTRARYFFFIPWMYLRFEKDRVSSADVAGRVRKFEIALIDTLLKSGETVGTIGRFSRASLQRLPSSIYWHGLGQLGIRLFPGTQSEYHRGFDRRNAALASTRTTDDGEPIDSGARAWHAGLPAAPAKFPSEASFALTTPEAKYLRERIVHSHRHSLFAFFADQQTRVDDVAFCWDHPLLPTLPADLQRIVVHAQNFSEVMHGAAILYNIYLAELEPRRDQLLPEYEKAFGKWTALMRASRARLLDWDATVFWQLLREHSYLPTRQTQAFVEAWRDIVFSRDPEALRGASDVRRLIFERENQIKGSLARCTNAAARGRWKGDSGLNQLNFRWPSARVILRDIADGLERPDA